MVGEYPVELSCHLWWKVMKNKKLVIQNAKD